MSKSTGKRTVARRDFGNGERLQVQLDSPKDRGAVLSAVPTGRNFVRGYVWIGDDDRGCYGFLPTKRLLALADAIREAEEERTRG